MLRSDEMLLNMSEVREELGVREEQQKPLDEILLRWQEGSLAGFDFSKMFQLSAAERRKQMEEMQHRGEVLTLKTRKDIDGVLDDQQRQRLKQLRIQQAGIASLIDPEIAGQLHLSEQQVQQIKGLEQAGGSRPGFGPPGLGSMEPPRAQAIGEALALLTDEQREKWDTLTGKAFTFPKSQQQSGPGNLMSGKKRKLLKKFDEDDKGWLNQAERNAARESKVSKPTGRARGFGPPGRGFGGRGDREPAASGLVVPPQDAISYPEKPLFDPTVLRTVFLEFENKDWEAELEYFRDTDVEVTATLTVDGRKYPLVGVHFRGMSSYMMVPTGFKRSLNLSLDFVDKGQRLYGYKTLNLLNCNGDPSFMSTALYSHIAREYMPAPKSNFMKVVINGESWGVYANVQQFNKIFLIENYKSSKGTRWKVRGNPGGDGGLRYLGEDLDEYKSRFQMKSNDGKKEWKALVELCRTLNETPVVQLEEALRPMLDIDEALWFLALDVALINSDGYWTRASDYSLFREESGLFHIIPHDMNEAFHPAGGHGPPPGMMRPPGGFPGMRPPPGGFPGTTPPPSGQGRRGDEGGLPAERRQMAKGGAEGGKFDLDPLVGVDNPRFALRSRLLVVPELRAKYLEHIRQIGEKSLDWKNLGPVVAQYRELIGDEVGADKKKLTSYDKFDRATQQESIITVGEKAKQSNVTSLRTFADQRRKYLLNYQAPSKP